MVWLLVVSGAEISCAEVTAEEGSEVLSEVGGWVVEVPAGFEPLSVGWLVVGCSGTVVPADSLLSVSFGGVTCPFAGTDGFVPITSPSFIV